MQPDTSTTVAARDHARAQGVRRVPHQPTVPASDAIGVVRPCRNADRARADAVGRRDRARWRLLAVLPRGAVVRITDLEGDACANVLVYNAAQPAERLNVADTVKVQWQAYLGPGSLLLSDMGRVLLTVMADTSGRHDAFCGGSNRLRNAAKYGDGAVHGAHPNARDRFAVALAKHGLGRRDVVPNVNFFKGVRVAPDGELRFDDRVVAPGAYVELRAELPVILVLVNTPHVLDPRPEYTVTPLRVSAWSDAAAARGDTEWAATPEAERAFLQTEEFVSSAGGAPS